MAAYRHVGPKPRGAAWTAMTPVSGVLIRLRSRLPVAQRGHRLGGEKVEFMRAAGAAVRRGRRLGGGRRRRGVRDRRRISEKDGSPDGIRTRDLRLERPAS